MDRRDQKRSKADEENSAILDKATGTIYIVGDISQRLASQFRQHMRTLERLKKHSLIQVEINSHGGDIESGLMMIDSILLSKKPVTTRVTGVAMSMSALILASGVRREALPNSTVMIHQGTYRLNSEYRSLQTEVAEAERLERLCSDLLDKMTGKPAGYWETRHDGKNLYLTSEQALTEGLIHAIVTGR